MKKYFVAPTLLPIKAHSSLLPPLKDARIPEHFTTMKKYAIRSVLILQFVCLPADIVFSELNINPNGFKIDDSSLEYGKSHDVYNITPDDRNNYEQEKYLWYDRLPKINVSQLQEGDIILKKIYKKSSQGMVVWAQNYFTNATSGSKYTSHAMIYVGGKNLQIAESSNECKGVVRRSFVMSYLNRAEYNRCRYLVYRCKKREAIENAVVFAQKWSVDFDKAGGNDPIIKYSSYHCILAPSHSSGYQEKGKERAEKLKKIMLDVNYDISTQEEAQLKKDLDDGTLMLNTGIDESDPKKITELMAKIKKTPYEEMMCSEFVTYCYQTTGNPVVELDARHTAPIKLEHYLNTHPDDFQFVGGIDPKP